jgi:hypothetical protein
MTDFDYERMYAALRAFLLREPLNETTEITKAIKTYFRNAYHDFNVHCSSDSSSEYMVDVLVTNFNPTALVQRVSLAQEGSLAQNFSLALVPTSLEVHLAVESELGGKSASSPLGVMRNVMEDFLKLLLISAKHRVMIMTSLPYSGEQQHVEARVEILRRLYALFPTVDSGALIVHFAGGQPNSSQVQVTLNDASISGFLLSRDGTTYRKLMT